MFSAKMFRCSRRGPEPLTRRVAPQHTAGFALREDLQGPAANLAIERQALDGHARIDRHLKGLPAVRAGYLDGVFHAPPMTSVGRLYSNKKIGKWRPEPEGRGGSPRLDYCMKKMLLVTAAILGATAAAQAGLSVSIGIGIPVRPVVVAPAPIYVPPPVPVYVPAPPPPVYVPAPPVRVCAPPPVYVPPVCPPRVYAPAPVVCAPAPIYRPVPAPVVISAGVAFGHRPHSYAYRGHGHRYGHGHGPRR